MSSSAGLVGVTSREPVTPRQVRTVAKLVEAAGRELRANGYDGLTVRAVARRAGVAPATAYTYFSSKEHLVTEAFWRRITEAGAPEVEAGSPTAVRIQQAFSGLTELFAGEPELVAACTTAMVADDPEVKRLRDRVGADLHRRFVAALPDAHPDVIDALDLAMSGSLIRAGTGHMSYPDIPKRMAAVAELLTGAAS